MLAHLRLRSSTQGSTPSIPINSIPGACRAGPRKHENVGPWEVSHYRDVPLATLCQNYAKNIQTKIMNLLSEKRTRCTWSNSKHSKILQHRLLLFKLQESNRGHGTAKWFAHRWQIWRRCVSPGAGRCWNSVGWGVGGGQSCLRFPIKGGNWMHLRFQCDFLEQI